MSRLTLILVFAVSLVFMLAVLTPLRLVLGMAGADDLGLSADRLDAAVQTHALASAAAGINTVGGVARTPADIEALLTGSAADAGVAVQVSQDGAETTFTVESAETARLFGWVAALERSGLTIASLSVLENADATLQAQGTVAP